MNNKHKSKNQKPKTDEEIIKDIGDFSREISDNIYDNISEILGIQGKIQIDRVIDVASSIMSSVIIRVIFLLYVRTNIPDNEADEFFKFFLHMISVKAEQLHDISKNDIVRSELNRSKNSSTH